LLLVVLVTQGRSAAQGIQPYPNAITDNQIHPKTAMMPPPVNTIFADPDFGSPMLRVTDETTDFTHPGSYLQTQGSGEENEWSIDSGKFWVGGKGSHAFAFAFDPSRMAVSSLPGAAPGKGLLLPLRAGATFSSVDPDLIYGTTNTSPLTITSYRFSSRVSTSVVDTRTCSTQPPLVSGNRSDDDLTLSTDDSRFSISEGGHQGVANSFVVIYDTTLGCRWYNSETGQIGGQWGPTGTAIGPTTTFAIRHAYMSKSGNYVRIMTGGQGFYVWDLATLNVTDCGHKSGLDCFGYGVVGYNSYVNAPGIVEYMQIVKRPLGNIGQISELVSPLADPHQFEITLHFTWSDVDANDSVPVCGTSYQYEGEGDIQKPWEGEVFCVETDGNASTIWRFAHNRANWITPYYNTQPLGGVSQDGRFFLFSSGWDQQLGIESDGRPRSDVWLVKLD
jgi:hypothetical protein